MTKIEKVFNVMGLNPLPLVRMVSRMPSFLHAYFQFRRLAGNQPAFAWGSLRPMLYESTSESGVGRGVYFYQDLIIAQRVFAQRPVRHVDIGSRIDGFVAHVASFREVDVFDIRPLNSNIPNVRFQQCDLMSDIPESFSECTDSLSCLHTLEHLGLGRYGDRLDVDGYLKGFENLHRILNKGGTLYFSVPLGEQRIEFNAHRVFSLSYLINMIERFSYRIGTFSYVDDKGFLHADAQLDESLIRTNCGCHYGCAIFEVIKTK